MCSAATGHDWTNGLNFRCTRKQEVVSKWSLCAPFCSCARHPSFILLQNATLFSTEEETQSFLRDRVISELFLLHSNMLHMLQEET